MFLSVRRSILDRGMPRECLYKVIGDLAAIRKTIQKRPSPLIGSFYVDTGPYNKRPSTYFSERLINLWCADLDSKKHISYHGKDPTAYYYAQHYLSRYIRTLLMVPNKKAAKQLAQF